MWLQILWKYHPSSSSSYAVWQMSPNILKLLFKWTLSRLKKKKEKSLVSALTASSLTVHFAQHQRLDSVEFSIRCQIELFSGILVDLEEKNYFLSYFQYWGFFFSILIIKQFTLENLSSGYLQCKDDILNKKALGESNIIRFLPQMCSRNFRIYLFSCRNTRFYVTLLLRYLSPDWTEPHASVSKDIMIQGDGNR